MERTRNTFLTIFGVSFLAALGTLAWLLWTDLQAINATTVQAEQLSTVVANQAATLTVAATVTPAPSTTPTTQPPAATYLRATTIAQAQATRASQAGALEEAQTWPLIINEPFDNNDTGWDTSAGDPDLSSTTRQITRGSFIWDIKAISGFTWVEPHPSDVLPSRYLASLAILQTGNAHSDQGLLFNYQDNDNFYLLSTCSTAGTLGLFRQVADDWLNMQSCRPIDALKIDQPNTLTVLADGPYFRFFVNDQFVSDLWDDTFSGGTVGLYVELSAEQSITFAFDELNVRSPDSGR